MALPARLPMTGESGRLAQVPRIGRVGVQGGHRDEMQARADHGHVLDGPAPDSLADGLLGHAFAPGGLGDRDARAPLGIAHVDLAGVAHGRQGSVALDSKQGKS